MRHILYYQLTTHTSEAKPFIKQCFLEHQTNGIGRLAFFDRECEPDAPIEIPSVSQPVMHFLALLLGPEVRIREDDSAFFPN